MESQVTSLPESLPSVSSATPQPALRFTSHQRRQIRASLADIERKEFAQFVTSMLRGHAFPSPDTVDAAPMKEGTIVRASNCDYEILSTGWRKIKVPAGPPRKSQLYLAPKLKRDKYCDDVKRISAREAGNCLREAAPGTKTNCEGSPTFRGTATSGNGGGANPSPCTT